MSSVNSASAPVRSNTTTSTDTALKNQGVQEKLTKAATDAKSGDKAAAAQDIKDAFAAYQAAGGKSPDLSAFAKDALTVSDSDGSAGQASAASTSQDLATAFDDAGVTLPDPTGSDPSLASSGTPVQPSANQT